MKTKLGVVGVIMLLLTALFTVSAFASDAQMYFSSDKNGQNRVTNIQEGDEIWIVIIDNDENIDCDVRDKIWTDIKIMDPKTGAYIIWESYMDENGDAGGIDVGFDGYVPYKGHSPGNNPGWLGGDYLEETGADTGVFVSSRAFKVGTRVDFDDPLYGEHHVDPNFRDFLGGNFTYIASPDNFVNPVNLLADRAAIYFRMYLPGAAYGNNLTPLTPGVTPWDVILGAVVPAIGAVGGFNFETLLPGRFENMDSLIGMYQDQNDATDVAIAMMKIIDTEATISWDQEIYKDGNGSAAITVVDPDENLNCNEVEWVPVFILVNPGSWNPVTRDPHASPNTFCNLLLTGGVTPVVGDLGESRGQPIRWYNIYMANVIATNLPQFYGNPLFEDGYYYIQYPTTTMGTAPEDDIGVYFDTTNPDGYVKVLFHAQETGVNTGVFQLNLNSLLTDLEFDALQVRDVLVAYYLDPNDSDDFKLATAYIEERQHSITSFTDANRADKDLFWIGRDPVYVQVIDSNANVDPCCPEQVVVNICDPHWEDDEEWLILDETSSNSPVFFTFAGTQLWPVWDALGVGIAGTMGGFQLQIDNWKIEAFNEDDMYARYNDVYYVTDSTGLGGIGDVSTQTAYPPMLSRVRVANDVSFDLMSVADTQVYDGSQTQMYFLDRQGNRVSGYVNSDCVFVEVVDPDQDEDQYRRERIDAYWDGGYNLPFGPWALNDFECEYTRETDHPFNVLLGDTNIFNDGEWAKLYVLNPRSGRWAAVDLLETGVATGDFVSVICIDLTSVYECVPQLGVIPGDTILAFYQDPSNHSDSAMISIKVGIGGGGTPPSQQSTTMFVDAAGNEVANYSDADTVYVRVIDPSHAGATLLASAVEIDGVEYDVTATGAADTFITEGLDLGLAAGDDVTATYVDPTDQTDTSADTITIIASVLVVDSFYAGPNPFEGEVTFGFNGTGVASTMTVTIYDLAGGVVYETTQTDVSEITWSGLATSGEPLANGCYIYVITATDGTNAFDGNGKVFVNR